MKKSILIILFIQLIIFSQAFSTENNKAEIIYIGNEGFMIIKNGKNILIDALYDNTNNNGITNVDESISSLIINNQEPFANSSLYFVTHSHSDHFNQQMVRNYLEKNPQSIVVADSTSTKTLITNFQNQIFSTTPEKNQQIDTMLNGITFSTYNLKHNSAVKIYNLGFWINIDGLRIFHGGDNILEDTTEYLNSNLFEVPVDVAFLNHNGFLKSTKYSEFIKRKMKPRYIVLMHIPDGQLSLVKEKASKLDESYPPIFIFNASMEKLTVTDTAIISNHRPEKKGFMSDTMIFANAPVALKIPFLFEDSDPNDSLLYTITGLPAGLSFDNENMIITGLTEKIGVFNIEIKVTDKSLCSNSISFNITLRKPSYILVGETKEQFIFPNPARDQICINLPISSNLKIQIFDFRGTLTLDIPVCKEQVDISSLIKGIYVAKLFDSGKVTTQKIIKE